MIRPGLSLALAALVWLPGSRDTFEGPHLAALLVGVLLAPPAPLSRSARFVLALLGLGAVLSTVTAVEWRLAVPGLLALAGPLLFASVSMRLDWAPVVWSSVPIAGWAALQALGLDPFAWEDVARWCGGTRPFSTLGHPTQLGVWMASMTVLALELATARHQRRFLLVALVTAACCVVTLSRAGWLALFVGVATWVVLRRGRSRRVLGVGALGALFVAVTSMAVVGPAPLLERLTHALTAPTRIALWKTSLAGFWNRPLVGHGFDAFVLVDQQWRQPEAWQYEWGGTAFHAHSFPAQVLATQGLVGVAVLLAIAALVLRHWRRQAPVGKPAELAVLASLAAASLVTFLGVLGSTVVLVALVRTLSGADERPSAARWLALPLLLSVGLHLSAAILSSPARAGSTTENLALATRLEPWSPIWPALEGEQWELAGELALARSAYEESVARVPRLAISIANVARVAGKQADPSSLSRFDEALRLAPLDARIALDAAEGSLRLGHLALASVSLERLVSHFPSMGPAWLSLGRVRLLEGRRREARAMLERGLEADWRDWPEGLGVARRLLAATLADDGQLELARKVALGPPVASVPGDACGAPARLR